MASSNRLHPARMIDPTDMSAEIVYNTAKMSVKDSKIFESAPCLPPFLHVIFRRFDTARFEYAAQLLRQAGNVVVLTGAGLSTPSGIPDFRSANEGLWSQIDPMWVASIWAFHEKPERFYEWMRPLAQRILAALPNPAHLALAELERLGKIQAVITQNIDALHQRAGSLRVYELHGHLRSLTCLRCGFRSAAEPFLQPFVRENHLPRCPACAAVLKPDAVLFGEPLPEEAILAAQEAALRCDVMLVAGSSLEVMPAADLPALAARRGARLIFANRGVTPYDHLADVILDEDVAWTLPRLAEMVKR